ncbi:tetratricopeptide repeat protein [Leptospira interrogans]|uniref:tetratricopeptide repeat protein n=1 Tax=Leptospira interrogans TaxID=173 RepID=UPI000773CA42|nr:hypothetical protein [Leptospira interrogans]
MKLKFIILTMLLAISSCASDRNSPYQPLNQSADMFIVQNDILRTYEMKEFSDTNLLSKFDQVVKLNGLGKFEEAKRIIEEILINYKYDRLLFEYGRSLLGLKMYKESIAAFYLFVKSNNIKNRNHENALYNISLGFSNIGDQNNAMYYLKRAIDKGFNDKEKIQNSSELNLLYQSQVWKENKQNIISSIMDFSEKDIAGEVTFMFASSASIMYLWPNNKFVGHRFPMQIDDILMEMYFGNWHFTNDGVVTSIDSDCSSKRKFDKYTPIRCKHYKSTERNVVFGSFISKADVADFFRGTKKIDDDGGYRHYKFKELPKQCEKTFVPKKIDNLVT